MMWVGKRGGRDYGTAIMLGTHDMGGIAETAHRVAVMYAGRVVEIGLVSAIVHRPSHPYTVGLMASIPRSAGGGGRLRQNAGTMPPVNAAPPRLPFPPRPPHGSPPRPPPPPPPPPTPHPTTPT